MKDGMLEFKDAPMFKRIMHDAEICKEVIGCILGIKVESVSYTNVEQEGIGALGSRGVRFDVLARDPARTFDVEMQTTDMVGLGRRFRYYQSLLDTTILGEGQDFEDLDESYVIFLCTFDPFGFGLPVYTLERRCEEEEALTLGDESHWVVLNACAWQRERDPERAELLEFIAKGTSREGGLT